MFASMNTNRFENSKKLIVIYKTEILFLNIKALIDITVITWHMTRLQDKVNIYIIFLS